MAEGRINGFSGNTCLGFYSFITTLSVKRHSVSGCLKGIGTGKSTFMKQIERNCWSGALI